MWAGIAGTVVNNNTGFEVAISIHDSVYNTDFASSLVPYDPTDPEAQAASIEKHVTETLRKFCSEHLCKFLGAGVTLSLLREVRRVLFYADGALFSLNAFFVTRVTRRHPICAHASG